MTSEQLIYYFKHPDELDKQTVSDLQYLVNEYPYFQSIQLLYLKNLQNIGDLQYHAMLKKTALYAADRSHLQDLMNVLPQIKSKTEEKPISKSETILTETTEYKLVESESVDNQSVPALQHQDLIDKFISDNPRIHPVGQIESNSIVIPDIQEDTDVSSSIFTESLAKIYIKQKQYTKALRIFEKLNLKYPEKSSYFADQIRFLDKIIQNNK